MRVQTKDVVGRLTPQVFVFCYESSVNLEEVRSKLKSKTGKTFSLTTIQVTASIYRSQGVRLKIL
jgi:hypothetical protein